MKRMIFLFVLLAACGDTGGPAGIDPTVQIQNQTNWTVHFEWRDGQGIVGTDSIPALGRACERFFARADSAYFYMEVTDPNQGGTPRTTTYTQPWFDPTERHAWSVTVMAGPDFLTSDTTVAC